MHLFYNFKSRIFTKCIRFFIILNCLNILEGTTAGRISRLITNGNGTSKTSSKQKVGAIGQELSLKCDCKSDIENITTKIIWQHIYDEYLDILLEKHEIEILEKDDGSTLKILRLSQDVAGSYTCELRLAIINDENQNTPCKNKFEVKLVSHQSLPLGETIGIVITVVVITLLGVGLCYELLRRKNRHGLSREEIQQFEKGCKDGYASGKYAHENVMLVPYDKTYEIPETKLKLNKDSVLGAGAFGIVFTAELEGRTVAVKSVKAGADKTYLKALLTELKVMIYVGRHPNIAELVGACSKDLGRGILYVVVTAYDLGNVENFIRRRRYTFQNLFTETGQLLHPNSFRDVRLHKSSLDDNLSTMDLLLWAIQVASAMEYLSNRNVIHGDLATRNVLLDSNRNAKVTDFGLARQIYEYSNYVKQSHEPLPWRSMAIESLRRLEFSTESDIWSYGVFLWELFTCGDVPYPNHNWSQDFVDKLEAGLRLHRPKYSTKNLYKDVMLRCFEKEPQYRIKYPEIQQYLESVQPSVRKMSSDGLR